MPGAAVSKNVEALLERCRHSLRPDDLGRELVRGLDRLIGFDVFCFGTVDPQSLLPTSNLTNWPDPEITRDVWRNEFHEPDVNKFRELALTGRPAARLSEATRGNLETSARFRSTLRACNLRHELRAVLCVDGECWGRLVLFRDARTEDFTAHDVAVLGSMAPSLARCLRAGAVAAGGVSRTEPGRGTAILDAAGRLVALTDEARLWLEELGVDASHRPAHLPEIFSVLVAAALSLRPSDTPGGPSAKLRTRAGVWLRLSAAPLTGFEHRQVAVTLEPAPDGEVAQLLLHQYGLSGREREIVLLVFEGWSTQEIARGLWISPYTVQDHLKSVFEKVGVRSRRELIATIFERHRMPLASGA